MRYMIMVKATPGSEADEMPSAEAIEAMGRFNDELIKAGVMLAGEGLRSTRYGSLVQYKGGKFSVTDGPFAEAKEVIAGFWIIDVKDKAEALEWVKRIPFEEGETIELRKVFEASDWAAGGVDPALIEREQAQRTENEKRTK
jgi:hypothetical protein